MNDAKPASGDGLIDREMIALALEYVAGDNTVTFSTDALRDQASLIRRLATPKQPGSSVQGETVECVICGGDGVDPEPHVEVTCCGRPNLHGDCCGKPEPEPVPQPCRQCGGSGKVIPVAQVFTTPPPAPAAEQGESINSTQIDSKLIGGQPEARRVEGMVLVPRTLTLHIANALGYDGAFNTWEEMQETWTEALAAANPVRAEQPEGKGASWADGVKACIAWVEKRRHDFEAEYGVIDPSTGVTEFRNTAREEYDIELGEIEEGLRAMLAAAPEPVRVDEAKDAERYRWIRKNAGYASWSGNVMVRFEVDMPMPDFESLDWAAVYADLDAAIDSAIAAQQKEAGRS